MEQAKFSFKAFRILDAELHFAKVSSNLNLQFSPEGLFDAEKHQYHLHLLFRAINENSNEEVVVQLESISLFQMEDTVTKVEEIPNYFYANSIAIIFPYLRAFVSTMTLQSNAKPMVLPTMNLSLLEEELRRNTQTR
jgi:preprotein translocase subunit SecB